MAMSWSPIEARIASPDDPDTDQNQWRRIRADSTASPSGLGHGARIGEQRVRAWVVDVGELTGQRHGQHHPVALRQAAPGQGSLDRGDDPRVVQVPVVAGPEALVVEAAEDRDQGVGSALGLGQPSRLDQDRSALEVAGVAEGGSEPDEQVAPFGHRDVREEGDGGPGPLELQGDVGGGLDRVGGRGRPHRVGEGLGRGAGEEALGGMVGELLHPRVEVIGPQVLQHLGGAGVPGGEARRVQLGRERAGHEGVGEGEPSGDAVLVGSTRPSSSAGSSRASASGTLSSRTPARTSRSKRRPMTAATVSSAWVSGRQPRGPASHHVLHGVGNGGRLPRPGLP